MLAATPVACNCHRPQLFTHTDRRVRKLGGACEEPEGSTTMSVTNVALALWLV